MSNHNRVPVEPLWELIGQRRSVRQIADGLGISEPEARRRIRCAIAAAYADYRGLWREQRQAGMLVRPRRARDPVTGMESRAAGEAYLENCRRAALRTGRPWSVAFADVDELKATNDRSGHSAGDGRLRRVAEALSEAVRRADRVFRWGGDEFLIAFPNTDDTTAEKLAERLRRQVAGLGVSIGIATWRAGEAWQTVVEQADRRMYEQKRRRRRFPRATRRLGLSRRSAGVGWAARDRWGT